MARTINLLDKPRIASPCPVGWDTMEGNDQVRFCRQCEKHVYNVTAMTPEEVGALYEKNGGLCVHAYRRADGTILLEDCPVGLARVRRRAARLLCGVAATIAIVSTTGSLFGWRLNGPWSRRLTSMEPFSRMANWVYPPPPPPPPVWLGSRSDGVLVP